MRALLLLLCCVMLVACGDTAPTPTSVDVPALQTQAAAINAVTTARAALAQPLPTTTPVVPAQATRHALVTTYLALAEYGWTTSAPATLTPLALTITAVEATLTALPTPP